MKIKLTKSQINHGINAITLAKAMTGPCESCEAVVAHLKSLLPKRKKGK